MTAPAIRNSWTRVAMRRVRTFPDTERRLVLDAIPKPTQDAIARAKSDGWLPAEHAVTVCDALEAGLGAEKAVNFWTEAVQDSYAGGLLGPLIDKLRHGELAHGLLDLASEAWQLSARDCGRVVLVLDENSRVKLEARDFPVMVRDSKGIQAMFAGALRAMLSFSKLAADVEVVTDETSGSIAFKLSFR
jgi:hypothetical protein